MMSPFVSSRPAGFVEPLEARIAPATILIGAKGNNDNSRNTEYFESPNQPEGQRDPIDAMLNFTDVVTGGDAVSGALKTGLGPNPAGGTYFYLHLKAGDKVVTFSEGTNYNIGTPLISVLTGDVIAVFTDSKNTGFSKNNYDDGEFTGLIMGPSSNVTINGAVNGNIITGLDIHATAKTTDDTIDLSGLGGSKGIVANLSVLGGNVVGDMLTGGNINKITLNNGVQSVLAGTAATNRDYTLFANQATPFHTNIVYANNAVGASISNGFFGQIGDRVEAGGGGFGGRGGSLTTISVTADTDGFALLAGDGGNADATAKVLVGGAGGTLTNIFVQGVVDPTANSVGTGNPLVIQGVSKTVPGVKLIAGDGGGSIGASVANSGGAGGAITGVTVGLLGTAVSTDLSQDSFHIYGGKGGDGKLASGAGGAIANVNLNISTGDDLTTNEIEIIAGSGGKAGLKAFAATPAVAGTGGAGGALTNITANNFYAPANPGTFVHSNTLVKAGDGGSDVVPTLGTGGAGGTVRTVNILGFDSEIDAGNGGAGNSGGAGGGVFTVTYNSTQAVTPHNMYVNAGIGGSADKLTGGAGGAITTVKAAISNIENLAINATGGGAGGKSNTGRGGAGGTITSIDFTDLDASGSTANSLNGAVKILAGAGGFGGAAGGIGGNLVTVRVEGDHFSVDAEGGRGGDATVLGAGGNGGLVSTAFFKSSGAVRSTDSNGVPILVNPTGLVQGGFGGDGVGKSGRGGNGGALTTISLSNDGDVTLKAGDGGSGQNVTAQITAGGIAGTGGSITSSGLISTFGSGSMLAGNGGTNGAFAGAGGNITGTAVTAINGVRAALNVTIKAGDGTHGGIGGNITTIGYDGPVSGGSPAGTVLVKAGDGSYDSKIAGRGGNITTVNGPASTQVGGAVANTRIVGGNGGGGAAAGSIGGTVTGITLSGGGANGGTIVIEAGNAGNGGAAGQKGGSVIDVGVARVAAGTIIKNIAAGTGGNGTSVGGAGGSIDKIFAPDNDIGYRTGQAFGYETQGGIFTGVGGSGGTVALPKPGLNGSVSNVTALSISSIVAGGRTDPIPHLAEKISNIGLNANNSQLLKLSNNVFAPDGDLVLSFNNESTGLITAHSSAQKVADALNALKTIQQVGGVTVGYTKDGGYSINFNQPGNQELVGALEIVTRDVSLAIPGTVKTIPIQTLFNGQSPLTVNEPQSGLLPVTASESTAGSNLFFSTEKQIGTSTLKEVQKVSLASLGSAPTAQFTLSFLGGTTAPLPANATTDQVRIALNGLPQLAPYGTVTVDLSTDPADAGATTYVITFSKNGRTPTFVGQAYRQEVETLDVSQALVTGGQFKLTFNGESTATFITFTAAELADPNLQAAKIQSELGKLNTVKSTNSSNTGAIGVTATNTPGVYTLTFSENGSQTLVTGTAFVLEKQQISFAGVLTGGGDTFVLRSGSQATVPLKVGASISQVQTALNTLPSIIAAGGVTVSSDNAGGYFVSFNQVNTKTGDQTNLTAVLLKSQLQTVDLSNLSGPTTDYSFHSDYQLDVNETVGGATFVLPTSDGQATPLDLVQGGQQRVTSVAGSSTAPTVTKLQFGNVGSETFKDGDLFVLTFTKGAAGAGSQEVTTDPIAYVQDQSASARVNTLAGKIQTALNALPNTVFPTGVIVTQDPASPFGVIVTYGTNGPQSPLILEGNTPVPHPGQYAVPASTTTQGTATAAEVQMLDLRSVVLRGGSFNLSFAGETTTIIPTTKTLLAATIQTRLGALSTVSSYNGVQVVEVDAGGLPAIGTHLFQVTFQGTGAAPQITGLASVPESQSLDTTGLTAGAEFTLTFKGSTTTTLNRNSTPLQIEQALARLSAKVPELVGVRVFADPSNNQIFRVDFAKTSPSTPNEPDIIINSGGQSAHETQHLSLGSLAAYTDGLFALSFNGETTQTLLQSDASAQDVANALNSLTTVNKTRTDFSGGVQNTGAVAVVKNSTGEYDITFNTFGQKSSISGTGSVASDRFPVTVTQLVHGTPGLVTVGEVTSGAASSLPVTETVKGSGANVETQRIDISTLNGHVADFTVAFGSEKTGPITVTGNAATDAAAIRTELNKLPTVKALQAGNTGSVNVSTTGISGVYDVQFVQTGDQSSLVVMGRQAEVQQIDLGNVAVPNAEFTLSYNGQKTAALHYTTPTATAAAIKTELNKLVGINPTHSSIAAVDVQPSSDPAQTDRFIVTFQKTGDQLPIGAEAGIDQSVQRIALGDLLTSDATFKLTFNGKSTVAIDPKSPNLANDVQTALNSLSTIRDTHVIGTSTLANGADDTAVHVVNLGNGFLQVTFDAHGDVPTIGGYSVVTHDRVVDVNASNGGSTQVVEVTELAKFSLPAATTAPGVHTLDLTGVSTDFTLQYGGSKTYTLLAGSGTNQIDAALDAIVPGGVTVQALANNKVEITFDNPADDAPITGRADISEGVLRLTVKDNVTQAFDTTQAVQVGMADSNGAALLATALNKLPAVQNSDGNGTGSVSVTTQNGAYVITFNNALVNPVTVTGTGTFSELPTLDVHKVTDGNTTGTTALPVSEATQGRTVGPVATTTSDGRAGAMEDQVLDLFTESVSGSGYTLQFGQDPNGNHNNDTTIAFSKNGPASDVEFFLNQVPTVIAAGGVTVTDPNPGSFQYVVHFNKNGDQPALVAKDTNGTFINVSSTDGRDDALEVQSLDLRALSTNSTFDLQFGDLYSQVTVSNPLDFASTKTAIEQVVNGQLVANSDGNGTGHVTVTQGATNGVYTLTFDSPSNDLIDQPQIAATIGKTTFHQNGDGVVSEEQRIDLSALANSAGSTFSLSFNGAKTKTPLSRFASAQEVQAAVNQDIFGGVTTVTVTGSNGLYDITFTDQADHSGLFLAATGNQEVQHIDTAILKQNGNSQLKLDFTDAQGNPVTVTVPGGSSGAAVQTALQGAGLDVNVADSPNGSGLDVTFNGFFNANALSASAVISDQQVLDLHQLPSQGGFIKLSANNQSTPYLPSDADAGQIEAALNAIGVNATVLETDPGVFQLNFSGNQAMPLVTGVFNPNGTTTVASIATSQDPADTQKQIESAIDNVSVSDVTLTATDALGHYTLSFKDVGSEQITGTASAHQQLIVDPFNAGDFRITVAGETTGPLPADANADQIRLALNGLDSVRQLGGVRDITMLPDTSFSVTFAADGSIPVSFVANQTLPALEVFNPKDSLGNPIGGDANTPALQYVNYAPAGAFSIAKFQAARLVGAIVDFNELGANQFRFYDLKHIPNYQILPNGQVLDGNGITVDPIYADAQNPFVEGDLPYDGIVMAKIIDQNTVNFVPEARLTFDATKGVMKNVFYDNLNRF